MNLLWTVGEMGIGYLFPQVGVVMGGYRGVQIAYRITKLAFGFFSGDPTAAVGIASMAAKKVVKETVEQSCEEIRDECIKATMTFQSGIGTGCGIVGCHAAYIVCKWLTKD